MKTYRAKLNINDIDYSISEINLSKNSAAFTSSFAYMDRKKIRNMVIESNLFSQQEVELIEKVGCEKVILNQMLISPMTKFRYLLAEREARKILKGLEFFLTAFGSDLGVVFLPKKNESVISSMLPHIRKMPNIYENIITDRYPLGMERVFSQNILNQQGDYFPGKGSSLILSPEKALRFYNFVVNKDGKNIPHTVVVLKDEKLYYVRGDEKMKVHSLLKKIGVKPESFIIEGDPLNGRIITDIQTEILKDKNIICVISDKSVGPFKCYKCGRCFEVCPGALKKTRSRRILNSEDEAVSFSPVDNCERCGLCSYFCPGWLK
ncbi:MAG: 4Fe-4S dicluster domain-containing protein [Elusimicrobiota bacterium]